MIGALNSGRGLALSILLLHAAAAVFFYSTGAMYKLTPYYWASMLTLAASIPYIVAVIKNRFFPYEGIYLFLAGHLIGFTAWLFLDPHSINLNIESWNYAMNIAFTGTLIFMVGYASIFGKAIANTLPLRRFVVLDQALYKIPMKLYVIGWALRAIPRLSEFGITAFDKVGVLSLPMKILNMMQGWEITNMLTSYGISAALMIDTCLYLSGKNKKAQGSRLAIFLILEISYGLLSGMAQNATRPIIFVFLAYIKTRKKVPLVPITLILILLVFYLVPYIKTFRQQYWHGEGLSQSVEYTTANLSDEDKLALGRDQAIIRLSNPLEMAVVCYEARLSGRRLSTYEGLPEYISRFVPRFIWPNKPSVNYNKIGRDADILNPDDYSTAISLTLIGGLIMDYGTYGVIAGMFLVGILLRMLWQWLVIRPMGNTFTFAVYSALIYRFIFPDDLYGILHGVLSFVIYTYFLARLVNRSYYKRVLG